MQKFTEIAALQQALTTERNQSRTIALVPTMGALHTGHLSLVEIAKKNADIVVLSIFVNPLQFNDPGDFEKYPRDLKDDLNMASEAGVDIAFTPSTEEIYSHNRVEPVALKAGKAAEGLEGEHRPGHFDGVVTVVNLLFNIVKPDSAVFGEKDFQQLRVIQEMVETVGAPIKVIPAPIVRDSESLALSSRNKRLSSADYDIARRIPKSLLKAQELVKSGEQSSSKIIDEVSAILLGDNQLSIEYVAICNPIDLKPVMLVENEARLLVAAVVGDVRLIDNCALTTS